MPKPCEMELTSSSFMKLPSVRSVGSGFRCRTFTDEADCKRGGERKESGGVHAR
jgi:hypothetical protein